ncbi:MAG: RNA polymerase sigma factor [Clostridia bacterium]|nr:RNA polymerase sigma factor [Clostridia bacterium]
MDSDAEYYRRFLDGDKNAFRSIIEDLRDGLTFFVDRYVHDYAAAEDIAVDCFADLLIHRHKYRFNVSLKTYLYMCGRSRALDHLKHNRVLRLLPEEALDNVTDEKNPEEICIDNEERRRLHEAIDLLQPDMRAAVHLVYFDGFSYDEAARVMKKNRKQIDNLLFRAKKELKTVLREEE